MSTSTLSEAQVQKQLEHMVSFILKEAQEKAAETLVKAREQFAREKALKIRESKQKLLVENEKRLGEVSIREKIERSNALNKSRLEQLEARERIVQNVLEDAKGKLTGLGDTNSASYAVLVEELILQGLIKIEEKTVAVNCRKADVEIVKKAVPKAVATLKARGGRDVEVTVDTVIFLPPAKDPNGPASAQFCSGGVVLTARGGRIVLDNTLDERLNLAHEGLLPQIRGMLFGYSETRAFYE